MNIRKLVSFSGMTVEQARERAEQRVEQLHRKVRELIHEPYDSVDRALNVHVDDGGRSKTGRSGYVGAKRLSRQRRYSQQEEEKILDKKT